MERRRWEDTEKDGKWENGGWRWGEEVESGKKVKGERKEGEKEKGREAETKRPNAWVSSVSKCGKCSH